ncbi:alpha/beta fold hydrolase [Glycomyces scopariae]
MTATAASEAPVRKRRKWLKGAIIALSIVVVLALAGLAGAGWYFSNELLKPDHSAPEYPFAVEAAADGTVTLPRDEETEKPGTWGLAWEDGQALIGDVVDEDEDSVTRTVDRVISGDLTEGEAVRIDTYAYRGDPTTALGLDFEDVEIETDLGDAPAWLIPADGATWVIAVHGRNASREETLRSAEVYHALGYPVLAVTYRNDEGAPAAENGLMSLGEYEADDVLDAVDYALANGASDVILHGISMGGSTVATAARKIEDPSVIRGIVFDSPCLDWDSTLDLQADNRNVIAPITWAAKRIVEPRADISLHDLDQRNFADEFAMPVLLFVDTADETVDHRATLDFAGLLGDRATLVESASGHTATWNEDPEAYAAGLGSYLSSL